MKKNIPTIALFAGLLMAAPARAVTLIHTNDVLGELEPCGCRNNPLGGMARKANLIKRSKDPEIIQVDTGDLFFSTDVIPGPLQNQSRLQAEYLLKSMEMTHQDAIVPGEKDFALGTQTLDQLRKGSPIHFLAANLRKTDGSKPFEKHVILTRKTPDGKTLRVALIGLVGEEIAWPKGIKVSPAIKVARAEVKAVRKKADLVIVLTHQGLDQDKALAQAVPGIDIIVGAHSQSFIQEPVTIGTAHLYQSSFRNQYVGVVSLDQPFTGKDYNLVGLDAAYDSPAQAPSEMDDWVKKFKTAIAELNMREDAAMQNESAANRDPAQVTTYHTFPRCAECHLKQFDFWRRTHHAEALTALIDKDQDKNKECLTCHTVGLGDPQGFNSVTRLAETRQGEEKQIDPLSTADYAAYLKFMHGASSLDSKTKLRPTDAEEIPLRRSLNLVNNAWAPVQCENCHQPGRDHPFSGTYSKKVETTACLKCHSPERAPDWYSKDGKLDPKVVEAKRALVTCPAGE